MKTQIFMHPLQLTDFIKTETCQQNIVKLYNTKFHENFEGRFSNYNTQRGQADMPKILEAFLLNSL
jgi:hypothetical protein